MSATALISERFDLFIANKRRHTDLKGECKVINAQISSLLGDKSVSFIRLATKLATTATSKNER